MGKEEVKLSLVDDYMTIHIENLMEYTRPNKWI